MSEPLRFTRFNSLPADIRIDIWRLAVEPRILEVRWDKEFTEAFFCKPQGVVSACYESHQAVASTPSTNSITVKGRTPDDKDKVHPFDYEHDILYLSHHKDANGSGAWAIVEFLSRVVPKDLERIKHIAVNLDVDPATYAKLANPAFERYGRKPKLNLKTWITVEKDKDATIHTKRVYDEEGFLINPDETTFVVCFRELSRAHNLNNMMIPSNFGTPVCHLAYASRQMFSEGEEGGRIWYMQDEKQLQQASQQLAQQKALASLQKEDAALKADSSWKTQSHAPSNPFPWGPSSGSSSSSSAWVRH